MQCYFVTWKGGAVSWDDTCRIDRIRRVHAQSIFKILEISVQMVMILANIPGFVKCFKLGHVLSLDHETNGKIHKHICAHCLDKEKQLNHAKKSQKNK